MEPIRQDRQARHVSSAKAASTLWDGTRPPFRQRRRPRWLPAESHSGAVARAAAMRVIKLQRAWLELVGPSVYLCVLLLQLAH